MISTQISPDVAALVEALISTNPGDLVTHEQLSRSIGRDTKAHGWLVIRAKDVAARDHGAVFASERGKGYVRLHPDDAHGIGATARANIKRKSRKAAKTIRYALARVNEVSPETARKANAELSVLGLIEHLSSDKNAKPQDVHERRAEPVAIVAQRLFDNL